MYVLEKNIIFVTLIKFDYLTTFLQFLKITEMIFFYPKAPQEVRTYDYQ